MRILASRGLLLALSAVPAVAVLVPSITPDGLAHPSGTQPPVTNPATEPDEISDTAVGVVNWEGREVRYFLDKQKRAFLYHPLLVLVRTSARQGEPEVDVQGVTLRLRLVVRSPQVARQIAEDVPRAAGPGLGGYLGPQSITHANVRCVQIQYLRAAIVGLTGVDAPAAYQLPGPEEVGLPRLDDNHWVQWNFKDVRAAEEARRQLMEPAPGAPVVGRARVLVEYGLTGINNDTSELEVKLADVREELIELTAGPLAETQYFSLSQTSEAARKALKRIEFRKRQSRGAVFSFTEEQVAKVTERVIASWFEAASTEFANLRDDATVKLDDRVTQVDVIKKEAIQENTRVRESLSTSAKDLWAASQKGERAFEEAWETARRNMATSVSRSRWKGGAKFTLPTKIPIPVGLQFGNDGERGTSHDWYEVAKAADRSSEKFEAAFQQSTERMLTHITESDSNFLYSFEGEKYVPRKFHITKANKVAWNATTELRFTDIKISTVTRGVTQQLAFDRAVTPEYLGRVERLERHLTKLEGDLAAERAKGEALAGKFAQARAEIEESRHHLAAMSGQLYLSATRLYKQVPAAYRNGANDRDAYEPDRSTNITFAEPTGGSMRGVWLPPECKGRKVTIRAKFEVVEGKASLDVDHYGHGLIGRDTAVYYTPKDNIVLATRTMTVPNSKDNYAALVYAIPAADNQRVVVRMWYIGVEITD